MPSAFDQSRYQVRLEWGDAGLARLAPADVVIVVDVLASQPGGVAAEATQIANRAGEAGSVVLLAGLRNASAVAAAVLAEQQRRAARTSLSLIAVGDDGRFTVEDFFGAGAVVDALGALGIDHTSPDAAAASESFRGLRRALRHLLTASGSGQKLLDLGRRDEVLAAAEIDATTTVPVLRDGVFVAA